MSKTNDDLDITAGLTVIALIVGAGLACWALSPLIMNGIGVWGASHLIKTISGK